MVTVEEPFCNCCKELPGTLPLTPALAVLLDAEPPVFSMLFCLSDMVDLRVKMAIT